MTNEDLLASQVQLSAIVIAKDVRKAPHQIACVGDAARFMQANFAPSRSKDSAWRQAEKALQLAATTKNIDVCIQATSAFILLLRTEGLFVDAE